MKQVIIFIIILFSATSLIAQQPENNTAAFPKAETYAHTKLSYKIIDAANKTYGYDIYADDKLMIHQQSIPAMPGNDGFKTKTDAEKVAQLVIEKIKKGEMPPTVSVEEMKKMKVIK
jgi:hypothetical protein